MPFAICLPEIVSVTPTRSECPRLARPSHHLNRCNRVAWRVYERSRSIDPNRQAFTIRSKYLQLLDVQRLGRWRGTELHDTKLSPSRLQHRLRPHHLPNPSLVLVVDPFEPAEPKVPQDLLRLLDRGNDVGGRCRRRDDGRRDDGRRGCRPGHGGCGLDGSRRSGRGGVGVVTGPEGPDPDCQTRDYQAGGKPSNHCTGELTPWFGSGEDGWGRTRKVPVLVLYGWGRR
jgi:hypothetical protein